MVQSLIKLPKSKISFSLRKIFTRQTLRVVFIKWYCQEENGIFYTKEIEKKIPFIRITPLHIG